jgi:hypothetical protein
MKLVLPLLPLKLRPLRPQPNAPVLSRRRRLSVRDEKRSRRHVVSKRSV